MAPAEWICSTEGIKDELIPLVVGSNFRDVARGHFTVRRLERLYGKETIRAEYDAIAAQEKIAS
jgi:hypothetical protein